MYKTFSLEMLPQKINLRFKKGESFLAEFLVFYDDTHETPFDFTNYEALMHVKRAIDTNILYEFSTSSNNIILNPGKISLIADSNATSSFTWESALYDLLLIDPNGNVDCWYSGNFYLIPENTE